MKSLAALRTGLALVCLPFFAAACGGGSASSPASIPAGPVTQQSLPLGSVQKAVARKTAGLSPTGCVPFQYSAPDLPAPCTIYVGGFISPTHGESPSQQIASTATFESQIGRKLALDMHYYQFTDAFPGIAEQDDLKNGRIAFDSWHCGDTDANIAAGVDDAIISKRAANIAAYGGPVFLRYKWEMNLTYNKKCQDPAHDVVESDGRVHYNPTYFQYAFDHIRAVFAANGASNVVWVFNPSSSGIDPDLYYPGDNYVDWISFDHYDTNMKDFQDTFSALNKKGGESYYTYPYFIANHPNKPFIIGETGIAQTGQQMFIGGADQALQQAFPNILAMVYWDSTGQRGQYQLLQYGIQAYAQFAAGPYEQGFYHAQ
jgi:hypothetical protein